MPDYPREEIELTYDERAVFGTCPVCKAGHGEWCHAEIGLHLGVTVGGTPLKTGQGAHLGRLQNAPKKRIITYA